MCNLSGTAVIIAVSKSFLWDGFLYIAKKNPNRFFCSCDCLQATGTEGTKQDIYAANT